ncbi:ABC transporter substrate-binding protein [Frankia sp. AgB1.9]|uniref:ABC transporter substrate-binding protein n=1 Tax=unclassified Frankia TaxID=2632575 RepID=UPI0019317172|nr:MULTISPECIES: ABC transporter substrate-binding protein [unclassified Frankia]MBL7492812.1 ABC transporter substrate-binding protein [Frankia sp. AgW1.1]MBL7549019.1 ABC transporter substrate-binding protein [Frankia sp. AgB1.9]MBL7619980.1 ABC transporter substrate-binding protein [Frankia sp. AgB1.8]
MALFRWRSSSRTKAAFLAAATGLTTLVACGGPGTTAAGGSCASSVPGITPTGVKAGMVWSDTGPSAETMRAFRAGVDARIDAANDQGGILGRRVTYAWRDDQADKSLNLHGTQDLVQNENVFGIIAMPSATSAETSDWLASQGIPVTGLASDASWLGKNNMFSWFYLGDGSVTTWGDYVSHERGTRAGVIAVSANASNGDFTQQIVASLKAAHITVVKTFAISDTTTNYASIAQQIKAAGIDSLAGVLLPDAAAQLIPALKEVGLTLGQGLKVAQMPLGYDPTVLAKYGRTLAGVSVATAIRPFEESAPGQQAFRSAMELYAPEIQPPTQDSAVDGWISADLFIRGLRAAGACPTRQSFISGLRAVKDYDGAGMSPLAKNDLSANYKQTTSCYYFLKISQDGASFQPQNGGQPFCGSPISPAEVTAANQ